MWLFPFRGIRRDVPPALTIQFEALPDAGNEWFGRRQQSQRRRSRILRAFEVAGCGVRGRKDVQSSRVPPSRESDHTLGRLDGFADLARRRMGTSGQYPRKILQPRRGLRPQSNGFAIRGEGFGPLSLSEQDTAEIIVSVGVFGIDLNGLPVLLRRLVEAPGRRESCTQIVVCGRRASL